MDKYGGTGQYVIDIHDPLTNITDRSNDRTERLQQQQAQQQHSSGIESASFKLHNINYSDSDVALKRQKGSLLNTANVQKKIHFIDDHNVSRNIPLLPKKQMRSSMNNLNLLNFGGDNDDTGDDTEGNVAGSPYSIPAPEHDGSPIHAFSNSKTKKTNSKEKSVKKSKSIQRGYQLREEAMRKEIARLKHKLRSAHQKEKVQKLRHRSQMIGQIQKSSQSAMKHKHHSHHTHHSHNKRRKSQQHKQQTKKVEAKEELENKDQATDAENHDQEEKEETLDSGKQKNKKRKKHTMLSSAEIHHPSHRDRIQNLSTIHPRSSRKKHNQRRGFLDH